MTRPGHRPDRSRRAAALVLLAGVLVGLGGLDRSAGFWTAGSVTPGSGVAGLISVDQGKTPGVSVTSNDIVVDWDASTLSNGMAVSGYTIQRYDTANGLQTTLPGCSGTLTATVCTEVNVPNGVWTYAVTPRYATSWAGPQSARSASVRSDGTAPTNVITRNAGSGGSFKSGTTIFYRGVAAGSFTLTSTVTDTGSGPASATTGALAGTTTGWAHTPGAVSTPAGGPYVSNPFSWTAGTTSAPTSTVVATDVNGNQGTGTVLTMTNDSTGPSGGAVSHVTGARTLTTLPVTLGVVTDAASGVAVRQIQQRSAALTGSTCGTFGSYAAVANSPPSPYNRTVAYGSCFEFQYVLTDNVGNTTTVPGPGVLRNRSYAAIVGATTGRRSHWRLNGAAAGAATVGSGTANTITWAGNPGFSAAGAIGGDGDTAVAFDGIDDAGTITRDLSGDFSVELWFKSTQGLGTGASWYDGAGLVDGDVIGLANDFGVSLAADGRITAGTGNPDTTIASGTGFNDGAWHHVVFTRTTATGALQLYVDGTLRASGTGRTGALTLILAAPLAFGRSQSGGKHYAGTLDEIATYTTVMPAATVTNHYQSGLP